MIAIATQCFGPDIGGVEALMTALADELARSGVRVEAFADHIRTHGLSELVRPYPIHRFGLWQPVRRVLKRRALTAATRRDPIAGVFTDSWKSVAAVPADAGPIATLAHGTEFPLAARDEKAARIANALARTRTIIASSRFTAGLVTPYLRGAAAEIVVINPPLPLLPEAEPAALAKIRAIIAGRHPTITTLARLEPRKGVDSVIAALPRLKARRPDLVYLVAGAGDDLARLRGLAAERGVSDSVVFLGAITDPQLKAALLTLSDVYAMPSRRVGDSVEGFGIAYAEAAWYGLPAVAGGDGAVDVVKDGQTGFVRDGNDAQGISQALDEMLENAELRKRMGAAAAAFVRENLTWRSALPRYLAALGR
ncbi:MAG: glycosyltransferase family 4 protein [Roseiarcus sp.]